EQAGHEKKKDLQKQQANSMFIQAKLAQHIKSKISEENVIEEYGKLHIHVNNAHASKMASIEQTKKEHLELAFYTVVYPTFYLMQAALPYLKESKGNIINFASGAGISGHANQASYAAAKEAIRAVTRVAANEFGPFGINVN